ncbi:MAG: SUMF1/EgtB/PvdO family nonheme iron enzyme [Bacteroidota bacterium]
MRTTLLFLSVFFSLSASATNVQIENVRIQNRGKAGESLKVSFELSWQNAWHNSKNHDAVWVFMKFKPASWYVHAKIQAEGHRVLAKTHASMPMPEIQVSDDRVGFFVKAGDNYRGDLHYKLEVVIDTSGVRGFDYRWAQNLKVYGIEMVYVPEGPFAIGDPDPLSNQYSAYYEVTGSGQQTMQISSEAAIEVGDEKGKLYYQVKDSIYQGDQSGPIPASFPKGYRGFYCMKYELRQGQYADFLNCLYKNDTYMRAGISGLGYAESKGSISIQNQKYVAASPNRPMNYLSWVDGCAFADWAGLRPMTEFEYTKAARGPETPIAKAFVWGTDNYDDMARYVDTKGDLIMAMGYEESQLSDENRATFGASYYWIMDLSGSLWEKVITAGDSIGRSFQASHGDGRLSFGEATNPDWPNSNNEKGGYGYRGGGYYETSTAYGDFNPHSPVAWRTYGAWSGGPRSIGYGFRAVRTAD